MNETQELLAGWRTALAVSYDLTKDDFIRLGIRLSNEVIRLEAKLLEYAKLADIHEENQSLLLAEIAEATVTPDTQGA